MGKGLLYQQQHYGDNGMWMDTQAQQQQSYAFHEESWGGGSDNGYHKNHFPSSGMPMKPHGAFPAMDYHGGGASRPGFFGGAKKHGFGDTHHHNMFSNGGGGHKFNPHGGHHGGYYSEETEYEEAAYSEEHHGGGGSMQMHKMDEHRNNWNNHGHGFNNHGSPYYQNHHMNMDGWNPHHHGGGSYKADWTAKGV
ncbi:hypothetical protein HN51_058327 [Arachis hypogaea]|uniref:Uncharacterized protein n=1 Tax=Arachis hypogaea TaxID=3818 RepID=A0A444X0N9_ARAHY|nr:histidine-rich glycoprotein [Arachis ipaensis]XP_025682731.1 histidine-rich glycoprotein [Arachis hypogaea]QHN81585.1 uncharacterized protein DS421_20g688130 [Arachis hypogaea]RYQ83225.1 hypothetical protein Ahy_B10g101869 [Arachis hypogaea]